MVGPREMLVEQGNRHIVAVAVDLRQSKACVAIPHRSGLVPAVVAAVAACRACRTHCLEYDLVDGCSVDTCLDSHLSTSMLRYVWYDLHTARDYALRAAVADSVC